MESFRRCKNIFAVVSQKRRQKPLQHFLLAGAPASAPVQHWRVDVETLAANDVPPSDGAARMSR
jgi:hypothetical protein